MTKGEASEAIEIAVKATLRDAKLPLLSVAEHSALVALRTVSIILDLTEPAQRIHQLIKDDCEVHGSRLIREIGMAVSVKEAHL